MLAVSEICGSTVSYLVVCLGCPEKNAARLITWFNIYVFKDFHNARKVYLEIGAFPSIAYTKINRKKLK